MLSAPIENVKEWFELQIPKNTAEIHDGRVTTSVDQLYNNSGTCLMQSPMGLNFFGWIRQVAALERCSLIFFVIIIISIIQY